MANPRDPYAELIERVANCDRLAEKTVDPALEPSRTSMSVRGDGHREASEIIPSLRIPPLLFRIFLAEAALIRSRLHTAQSCHDSPALPEFRRKRVRNSLP